jgi:hypothetical protein
MRKVDYQACITLEHVADATVSGLAAAYDHGYVEYLRRMPYYLSSCRSYRELGTNQGGSTSIAVLANLDYYELIDKSFSNFRMVRSIVEQYVKEHNIKLICHEMSSLEVQTETKTDFLLIDSVHRYKHVMRELEIYASLTNRYIMFHDTHGIPEVGRAADDFLSVNAEWQEVERHEQSAGFIVIERTV